MLFIIYEVLCLTSNKYKMFLWIIDFAYMDNLILGFEAYWDEL